MNDNINLENQCDTLRMSRGVGDYFIQTPLFDESCPMSAFGTNFSQQALSSDRIDVESKLFALDTPLTKCEAAFIQQHERNMALAATPLPPPPPKKNTKECALNTNNNSLTRKRRACNLLETPCRIGADLLPCAIPAGITPFPRFVDDRVAYKDAISKDCKDLFRI